MVADVRLFFLIREIYCRGRDEEGREEDRMFAAGYILDQHSEAEIGFGSIHPAHNIFLCLLSVPLCSVPLKKQFLWYPSLHSEQYLHPGASSAAFSFWAPAPHKGPISMATRSWHEEKSLRRTVGIVVIGTSKQKKNQWEKTIRTRGWENTHTKKQRNAHTTTHKLDVTCS